MLPLLRNQSVVRQPNAFKSERAQMSKQRFASQVDVNKNLSKPVTQHYLPKKTESAFAKPDHIFKGMLLVANQNLGETITSRSLPVSKSTRVTITAVPKADHSKSSSSFSDSKQFVCSTCHKCVFNANHDACITKLLKEVNSRAKVPSNKTTNRNKPVEQIRIAKKPERQIPTGHRFSIKKTSAVHEKTMTLRSCLRWKPTGKIFRTVGLRWVPTGKIFTPSTTKVDSEPPNGSNADITNQYESAQTLDVSAGTSNLSAGTSFNPKKEELRLKTTVTTSNELDLLFGPLFDEYLNGENQVVLKSSAVTTADASDKRQQQPDSTSSTSTLATSVTADGNFDLAQVDQGSQIKMIQVKEMMQDNDLKNSKSKDKGSRSRSQSMNEQSHYKQDKTKTRQSINVKSHIFNVRGDNDKSKQTPTRMSSVVRRSLKKETSTLGEIVSLNYIKSNKNVIGLIKSN
ncbi:hypothetical protein Tco_1509184 [Tanacetum coccineum]